MAWTFWQPTKPTNLTGTLVSGVATSAPLLANTTYYFKVIAWDRANTDTGRANIGQTSPQVYSPYSETFSITTTTTDRKVSLTWDKVYKRNGVTEVDGYEVLISTSDDFSTDVNGDKKQAFPSDWTYFNACVLTNSATATKVPAVGAYWKMIPYGIPYCEWDGASTCTFKSLYDAMKADPNYAVFAEKITTFDVYNVLAYRFFGYILVKKYTGESTAGGYSFSMNDETVFIMGGISVTGLKYYINNSVISLLGSTHSGDTSFFLNPTAGSIQLASMMRFDGGSRGALYAKSWGKTGQTYAPVTSANLLNINNLYNNWNQTSIPINTPEIIYNGNYGGSILNSQEVWAQYYNIIATGKQKKIICNNTYFWTVYNGLLAGFDVTLSSVQNNNFQQSYSNYVDCIWRYRGLTGAPADGWDFRFTLGGTTYGPNLKNSSFFIGKTIIPTVLDSSGNPIQNAKIVLRNNAGKNITRPAGIENVCKVSGAIRNANTYELAETIIKHDQEQVYLYESSSLTGGITTPVTGNYYWYGPEKVKVLERIGTTDPLQANHKLYRLERGIDNTPTGWILEASPAYNIKLVEAPEYLLTDANGKTNTIGMFKNYKSLVHSLGGTGTRYLSEAVSVGNLVAYDYGDLILEVSKEGYETQKIVLTPEDAVLLGTEVMAVEITLKPALHIRMTIEGRLLLANQPELGSDSKLLEI